MNKTTKTILWVVVAVIVIGGIWYGISKKPQVVEKEPIKIGYVAVLSGPAATSWGFYARDAAELATDEINTEKGVKLQIKWGDSAAKPEQGVTEFKKLNETEKPDVFIVDASSVASAIAPLADQYKKPITFGTVALEGITKQSEYLFRNFYLCEDSASLLAKKAYEKLGLRKIAILSANEAYAQSCHETFKEEFTKLGGNIVADEKFLLSEMDFKTYLTKIKSADPEAIYIIGYENGLSEIVKKMKELEINKTILAEMVLYAPVIRNQVVDLTNPPEVYMASTDFYLGKKADEFKNKFETKYGTKPPYLAGYIYDTVYIIARAAKIADKEGISLKEALKKVKLDGVSGFLEFDEDRETHTKWYFVKLNKDGSLQILE